MYLLIIKKSNLLKVISLTSLIVYKQSIFILKFHCKQIQTVLVRLVNNDKEKVIWKLLDSALQKSYMASKCVKFLKFFSLISKISEKNLLQIVFSGIQTAEQKHEIDIVKLRSTYR